MIILKISLKWSMDLQNIRVLMNVTSSNIFKNVQSKGALLRDLQPEFTGRFWAWMDKPISGHRGHEITHAKAYLGKYLMEKC